MNVFVLWRQVPYEFGDPLGVFSTAELAKAAGDGWRRNAGIRARVEWKPKAWSGGFVLGEGMGEHLHVDPFTLDEAP